MSLRALQAALILCVAAAAVIMLGLLPVAVRVGLLAAIVLMTALTAAERHRPGGGWWQLLAAGAALSVAGFGLSEVADTAGGLVALAGAALVIIAAAIGFPLGD